MLVSANWALMLFLSVYQRVRSETEILESETLSLTDSTLPHCKRTTVVTGEVVQENIETTELSVVTTMQLQLSLRETACFHVNVRSPEVNATAPTSIGYNETLMYSLQYAALEDHHPIRARYEFGIPKITSTCKCDCEGGADHCRGGSQYQNCTKGALCHTTAHLNMAPTGCPSGKFSDVCCEVSMDPYKDWRFWAISIGTPDITVASFILKLYSQERRGEWSVRSANRIYVPLHSKQAFTLGRDKLRLSVAGTGSNKHLNNGMYWLRSDEKVLRTGLPLNQMQEWDVGKLGWFRLNNGRWEIRAGAVKVQDAHHVKVTDCKAQTYEDSFNAEGYVSMGMNKVVDVNFIEEHGHPVEELERWIISAQVRNPADSRIAVISHREAPALTVDLTMDNRPVIRFFHHRSELVDFSGDILLDKYSNRFLNISFAGSKGTLLGNVYRSMTKEHIDVAFSTYVHSLQPTNHSSIISLPSSVNGSRWVCFDLSIVKCYWNYSILQVCFTPAGEEEAEKCKWFRYHATPLPW